jgi:hypothetical protein
LEKKENAFVFKIQHLVAFLLHFVVSQEQTCSDKPEPEGDPISSHTCLVSPGRGILAIEPVFANEELVFQYPYSFRTVNMKL